ncbi:hypothetical protein SY83_12615 [Paenibacillus swuensis]|uniref:Uncharacterized protein n=1 Tax=Paenibacillus swuensis TaxID=1178515 RepID=A0A172TJF4_9BACL|nr:hypothetical protein [Paenibacillus swuensis]ANE46977.1 hypothetical protein SY83_12615 [Paenibacillus swuensis]
MGKHIQAYFRNENDALDVTTKLNKYSATKVESSELVDHLNTDRERFLFPIAAVNAPTTGTGAGNYVAPAGVPTAAGGAGLLGFLDTTDTVGPSDDDRLTHTLTAEVGEADYSEIVQMIRENGGYVDNDGDLNL